MTFLQMLRSLIKSAVGGRGLLARAKRRRDRVAIQKLVALLGPDDQPNLNALALMVRNIDIIALNVKTLGYDLARTLQAALPVRTGLEPRHVGLGSKASVQVDIESDWMAYWCQELGIPVVYHRKIWELGWLLQMLHDADMLHPGVRALGFGTGNEPLPSLFAARGIHVTMTDLMPDDVRASAWMRSEQHAGSLEKAHHPHLVDVDTFNRLVEHRYVDMTAIPDDLRGYDFTWSICALEHLGSIAKGLDFIENSLETLRPGGVSIHTTEFNVNPDGPTVDNWPTVLFQRRHMEELAERLRAKGHHVAPFDFSPGEMPFDNFIDVPPYSHDTHARVSNMLGQPYHLKLAVDGFVACCFGIAVTKAV